MARLPSVMSHSFSQVPKAEIPRSSFDRSHGLKTTFSSGYLIPIFVDEVLPGDTYSVNMTVFARLATPLHPVMDNMVLNSFFFFIPNRLIWTNWQRFNGEQDNPGDSIDFLLPQMQAPVGGYASNSIYDYFGLPTLVAGFRHCSLPFRAYNLCYNEWFRDQNLQNSVPVAKGDTNDPDTNYTLLRRGKRHDYFTSAEACDQGRKAEVIINRIGGVTSDRGLHLWQQEVDGVKQAPPKFYLQKLTEEEQQRLKRQARTRAMAKPRTEKTMERRLARAAVRDARIENLKRKL